MISPTSALLRHVWRTRPTQIAAGSYLDCHVKGLHSLLLVDAPGSVIRMFITTPDHDMGRNFDLRRPRGLSLAFHSHDADLTLHVIRGQIWNIGFEPYEYGTPLREFRYDSKIRNDGAGGFKATGTVGRFDTLRGLITTGESLFMRADEYHTVSVLEGERAAWFVYEGAKDPKYQPIVYSNADLETFSPDGLYRRPTVAQVHELLEGLL